MSTPDTSLWAFISPEEVACAACGELIVLGEGVTSHSDGPHHFPGCNEEECRRWLDAMRAMTFDFPEPTDTEGGTP